MIDILEGALKRQIKYIDRSCLRKLDVATLSDYCVVVSLLNMINWIHYIFKYT